MSRTDARCKDRDGWDKPGPDKCRRWRGTVIAVRAGTSPPSRGAKRPSRAVNLVPQRDRGRRECRMPIAPAASRAKIKKHTSVVTTGPDGFNRHSLRNGFNVYFVISPVNRAYLSPSLARRVGPLGSTSPSANLMPASRHQDHTTSPSALVSFASRHYRVHRIPRPTSVTMAKRPSCGHWMRGILPVIWG
jgi:hypothetical protein